MELLGGRPRSRPGAEPPGLSVPTPSYIPRPLSLNHLSENGAAAPCCSQGWELCTRWEEGSAAGLAQGAARAQSRCLLGPRPWGPPHSPGCQCCGALRLGESTCQHWGAVSLGDGPSVVARAGLCSHTSPGLPAGSGQFSLCICRLNEALGLGRAPPSARCGSPDPADGRTHRCCQFTGALLCVRGGLCLPCWPRVGPCRGGLPGRNCPA